jgi:hypothetical protein
MDDTRYDPQENLPPRHHDLSEPDTPPPGTSSLELLRHAADSVAADVALEFEPVALYSPGERIKLICDVSMTREQIDAARDATLSRAERRKPLHKRTEQPDPAAALARLIAEQTREIWILDDDGRYKRINGDRGEPLAFDDPYLLATFGTADASAAVRRIFGGDNSEPYIIHRGGELMDAGGWSEEGPGGLSRDPR